jgi:hypothetical protein
LQRKGAGDPRLTSISFRGDPDGEMGEVAKLIFITKKLSTQQKITRALRIIEKREDLLKLLIDKVRRKNSQKKEQD